MSPAERAGGPRRTCIGCRTVRDASALERIVRTGDASLAIGRTLPGRGAWLCQGSTDCFELAAGNGGFARAFRAAVRPDQVAALRIAWTERARARQADFVSGTPAARD